MAPSNVSTVDLPLTLTSALSFENTIKVGLMAGLYGERERKVRITAQGWDKRLCMTTTWPDSRVGQ